jgi:demethylmenaquinone methyltransferase/2-methoxy-6-polyprenyl-1,4-benzoquinol methylase
MANPYFKPGELRAAQVDDLFGGIARRYDRLNDLQSFGLHRLWKRRLVRLGRVRPGDRALDVCCGTGDIAFALARRGAAVVGLDFNTSMLTVARARAGRLLPGAAGLAGDRTFQTRFLRGDAQRIPFRDDTFEIVTVGYGLRNLASWEGGLREMQRVARPGGRLLVLDFARPDQALWRGVYFGYLKAVVPWLGRVFAGNAAAYAYILESLRHFPAPHTLAERMQAFGLRNVRVIKLLGGLMSIHYAEKAAADQAAAGI